MRRALIVKIRDIGRAPGARQARAIRSTTCPYTTAHTGVVHGGTALNIVPDVCTFEFEFRTIAADDADALVDEVMAYARDELEPEMRAVDPAAGIAFETMSGFPGLETPRRRPMSSRSRRRSPAATSTARSPTAPKPGCSRQAGIPTVVIGPGSIDQAHKADEYIAVAQLEACGAFIDRLIAHSRA